MKYGIINNNKFLFIDEDKQRLINTLAFLPDYTESDIKEYEDDAVEQAYDGVYYLKGFAPIKPEPTHEEKETILQARLKETDYVALKMAEFSDNKLILDELKEKYAEVLAERSELRKQINELRGAE